jgi:O-antigen ligase
MSGFVLAESFSSNSDDHNRTLIQAALVGLLLGIAILLIELSMDTPLMRFVHNNIISLINPTRSKAVVVDGAVTRFYEFLLNRNVVSIVMLLIPSLLFAVALGGPATRIALPAALMIATAACVPLSDSGTSLLALLVASIVFVLGWLSLRVTRHIIVGGFAVVTILAVPLVSLPFTLNLQAAPQFSLNRNPSFYDRIYIWQFTAQQVKQQPVIGIGVRSARTLSEDRRERRRPPKAPHAGWHPHNIFLQTWLELGAVGAGLLLTLGCAALWQLRRLPPPLERAGYALFATCGAVGSTAFDLWQTSFLASVALSWSAFALAHIAIRDRRVVSLRDDLQTVDLRASS